MKFDPIKRYGHTHSAIIEYLNGNRWLQILDGMYLEMSHLIPPEYRKRVYWRIRFEPQEPFSTLIFAVLFGQPEILRISWVYEPCHQKQGRRKEGKGDSSNIQR